MMCACVFFLWRAHSIGICHITTRHCRMYIAFFVISWHISVSFEIHWHNFRRTSTLHTCKCTNWKMFAAYRFACESSARIDWPKESKKINREPKTWTHVPKIIHWNSNVLQRNENKSTLLSMCTHIVNRMTWTFFFFTCSVKRAFLYIIQ